MSQDPWRPSGQAQDRGRRTLLQGLAGGALTDGLEVPPHSYLLHKVQGTHLAAGGSGARMPLTTKRPGLRLGADQIEIIAAWMRSGARGN